MTTQYAQAVALGRTGSNPLTFAGTLDFSPPGILAGLLIALR